MALGLIERFIGFGVRPSPGLEPGGAFLKIMGSQKNSYATLFATCEISFVLLAMVFYFIAETAIVPSLLIALAGSGILSLLHWQWLVWRRKKKCVTPEEMEDDPE